MKKGDLFLLYVNKIRKTSENRFKQSIFSLQNYDCIHLILFYLLALSNYPFCHAHDIESNYMLIQTFSTEKLRNWEQTDFL